MLWIIIIVVGVMLGIIRYYFTGHSEFKLICISIAICLVVVVFVFTMAFLF